MPGYSKNDVVLTRYPFSDLSSTKVRPAIVISSPHESQDVFVVPLTSRIAGLLSGEFILADWQAKFQRALHNPDKRVYLYIVTPAGLKAKSELTYRFLKVTLDFYNQVEAKVQQTLATMEKAGIERVVLGQRCGPHGTGADPQQRHRSSGHPGAKITA